MKLRTAFLHAVRPISRMLDKVNLRIGRPPLHGSQYHHALGIMRPGDILLTRTKWRPTNMLLPGRWTHALMALGGDEVVEATMPAVRTCWLVDVWAGASEVVIVRPRFLSEEEAQRAARIAASKVGTPYDLEFRPGARELYCSELIYHALSKASAWTPDLRTRQFGVSSIVPDAFTADRHFTTLFDSRHTMWATRKA